MAITYYKRFRMEIDLDGPTGPAPEALPPHYAFVGWDEALLERHAEVKFLAFHEGIDSHVFPCLGERQGCQRLMREIRRKPGFLPDATWLVRGPVGYVGTIQGVIDRGPIGAIQNVGVAPAYPRPRPRPRPGVQEPPGLPRLGPPSRLSGGHGRELLGRPPLPRSRLPQGEDALQSRGRLTRRTRQIGSVLNLDCASPT